MSSDEESPQLVIDESTPELQVHKVLKRRTVTKPNGKIEEQFLVSWKGYPNEDNSWEPRECLGGYDADADLEAKKAGAIVAPHLLLLWRRCSFATS